jgi:hypothetical protein
MGKVTIMSKRVFGFVGLVALAWTGAAQAQCVVGSADYDTCFFQQLNQLQYNNNQAIQQNYAAYMQAYGPQLQQAYQEWGYQSGATFEQFAYYMLMSANGTDPQGALDAQKRQFDGLQAAHESQVQGGQTYIDGIQQNSDRAINAVEGYDTGAVRGNVVVNGPDGPVELPWSGAQYGQQFEAGGYTYMLTQQGYAVWNGYGWQLVQ